MTKTFYRPAVASDFANLNFRIEERVTLSEAQLESILAGKIEEVVEEINRKYGVGRKQLNSKISEIAGVLKAKADFNAGKPVFIEY